MEPRAEQPPVAGGSASPLRLRRVAIDTWRENVAYLHRDCAIYRAEGFQALSKVEVRANGRRILATLNVVDDGCIVQPDELGLSIDAFVQLGVDNGHPAMIAQAEPPSSIPALHRKIAGERLAREDFRAIVRDIAEHRYSKIELTAFVVATNQGELDREEVTFLTEAMAAVGHRIDWHERPVVDKHCIGGIPGNRTSMLVVPIVAAHGMLCPKTSSRAITSPAGTADTMEVLARVELSTEVLSGIVREHRGCLAWGGTANLSPADDVLISVERPLSIDSPGQMVASILSKKLAAGSTHLVLDIPVDAVAASGLFVQKKASRGSVEVGEFVDYEVRVRNGAGVSLGSADMMLVDDLPAGFAFEPGSARRGGARLADPAGGRGPRLVFNLGRFAEGEEATISYRVRVGGQALRGDGVNRVQATWGSGAAASVSNVATAVVQVTPGVFTDRGYILGRVFLDCNANGVQDGAESGVPGVRLFLEDGTNVITDGEGQYSFYGIRNRTQYAVGTTSRTPKTMVNSAMTTE